MISKSAIFCRVIEEESFTKVATEMGYSQSAVSQMIKSLENELGTILINRKKDGIELTKDGREYYPYLKAIANSEKELTQKKLEMDGLENTTIKIGCFTSISRNLLPSLMKDFKNFFPGVKFVLQQGDYDDIEKWVTDGSVDFGFVGKRADSNLESHFLYKDELMAILPKGHKLEKNENITLQQLADETFILLDEGDYSLPMTAFSENGLKPHIAYKVYDDYTILAMIRQGLGVSIMYRLVVSGFEHDLVVRKIETMPKREVSIICRKKETMSLASKRFQEFIMKSLKSYEKSVDK